MLLKKKLQIENSLVNDKIETGVDVTDEVEVPNETEATDEVEVTDETEATDEVEVTDEVEQKN